MAMWQYFAKQVKESVRGTGIVMNRKLFLISAIAVGCIIFYNEWLIYYVVLYQCSWPEIYFDEQKGHSPLKAIFLADTHLLGFQDGHWFDRLRREWQMERAFQTALSLFKPQAVFVLGDLFDEGMKSPDQDWIVHLRRFFKMFSHSADIEFHVVVGNHDIGFHYIAKEDIHLYQRFSEAFGVTSAKLVVLKDIIFVLVNSVALEGDDCTMCSEAAVQLKDVSDIINCHTNNLRKIQLELDENTDNVAKSTSGNKCKLAPNASIPILLQHYPLYRPSESHCTGVDAPPIEQMHQKNREKWEVVSRDASKQLLEWFRPRLVLSGHTHHGCYLMHNNVTPEMTIPSFSWRNRNNPSFILGTFTKETFKLTKCFLPEESTVIIIYVLSGVMLFLFNGAVLFSMKRRWRTARFTYKRSKRCELKSL